MSDKESNLPGLSTGDLSALLHGSGGMLSPFSTEIYIGRQSIVGMRFQGGAALLVKDLKPGDRISFLREPDNEFDARAIMAVDGQGRKLGYIPKRENLVMSALMDHGKVFYGVIPDVPREEYAYSRTYPKQMLESEVGIPVTITVDLYMREFTSVDDMTKIPRHGSDGSYAVVSLWLSEDKPDRIRRLCAIKVINGEERGILDKRIFTVRREKGTPEVADRKDTPEVAGERKDTPEVADRKDTPEVAGERQTTPEVAPAPQDRTRSAERRALNEFSEFIGFLPIVSHGINGNLRRALEDAYGVLLGKPLSNLIIDTEEMAENHLPAESTYKLDRLVRKLRIHVHGDSHAERCCRRTWELYRRMDKSELFKDV